MKYLESYQFVFRSPKWPLNFLICMVAPMVPVVGAMVVLGYHFDIIEAFHRRGEGDYPEFDFNRLMDYLKRGLWPVLVQLIVTLPLAAVFSVLSVIFWFGLMAAFVSNNSTLIIVWLAFGAFALLFGLVIQVAANMVLIPMELRAGLMADFGAAFSWPFIRDFLSRTWKPTLLAELFLVATGTVLAFAGMLVFGVGMYIAVALIGFARAYMLYQLYEEYLRQGGQEIATPLEAVEYPDRNDRE